VVAPNVARFDVCPAALFEFPVGEMVRVPPLLMRVVVAMFTA